MNQQKNLRTYWSNWQIAYQQYPSAYRMFAPGIASSSGYFYGGGGFDGLRGGGGGGGRLGMMKSARAGNAPGAPQAMAMESMEMMDADSVVVGDMLQSVEESVTANPPSVDLDQVTARKNLSETAFFYPHLMADDEGVVRIEFEIPEALTKWKIKGLAHDQDLRAGVLTDEVTTSKDLMVQPNPPRFLREGDELEFSAKVSNQSATSQVGRVRLNFVDLRHGRTDGPSLG